MSKKLATQQVTPADSVTAAAELFASS